MPSKDTVKTSIHKNLRRELERIQKVLEEETGIRLSLKQAGLFLKHKSELATLTQSQARRLAEKIYSGLLK